MNRSFLFSLSLIPALMITGVHAQSRGNASGPTLYRWTNEQGITVYSATLPQEAIRQGREIINTQTGEVIKQVSKPQTQEERLQAQADAQASVEKAQADEVFKDIQSRLLQTYPDERSITEVYLQKLAMIDGQTKRLRAEQSELLSSIIANLRLAADHEMEGNPIPPALHKTIQDLGNRWQTYSRALEETKRKQTQLNQEESTLKEQWNIANRYFQREIDLTTAQSETLELSKQHPLIFE